MPNLKRLRAHAFSKQGGRCFYCNAPMWESSPAELSDLGSTPFARALRCTAEHLQAREDGGRNTRHNIVAACWHCNSLRHRRKVPLDPEKYRRLVQARLARGRWHAQVVVQLLTSANTSPTSKLAS